MSVDIHGSTGGDGLANVLEPALDRGVAVAGDATLSPVRIEFSTIKPRLIVGWVDKAREIGIDGWTADPRLSIGAERLIEKSRRLVAPAGGAAGPSRRDRRPAVTEAAP